MEPIIARRSIRHYAWSVGLAAAFLVASEAIEVSRGLSVPITLAIGLAGPLWALARATTGAGEVLRIDDSGISDSRLPIGRIPWDQVTGARTHGKSVYVVVRDPAMLGLKVGLWRRLNQPLSWGGQPGVSVKLEGLDVPAETIAGAIHERLALYGDGPAPDLEDAEPVAWGSEPDGPR